MWTPQGSVVIGDDIEIEDAKSLIRSEIRQHRGERSPRERSSAGEAIAAHVAELLTRLGPIGTVAAFAARPSEPDTGPVFDLLHEAGVQVMLPMLGPGLSRDWAFYRRGDTLGEQAPGRPPAPSGPGLGETAISRADLVLAPALSVDARGARLGQGGGWYDRALRYVRPGVRVYAVLFDDELSEPELPTAEHDRPVDGVITPAGVHELGDD
ncbi:5-formyltetrahydrofolate cyclo-ligase [Pseudactinotalea sp. HY160]|uniref:5-formyltetrahydrofolate cyclo-ligase n=1 Tax=Pseudactinotalea sp. HY160 TaxID=2654490 RepID=UPI00128E0A27|nr:5-formyltetrahydrofolate cyclo-ligase [Pseudactinotalea sp. HY160]